MSTCHSGQSPIKPQIAIFVLDVENPTSVTEIDEAGTVPAPEAVTTLSYYGSGDNYNDRKYGRPKNVVPPYSNTVPDTPVVTTFDYARKGARKGVILLFG